MKRVRRKQRNRVLALVLSVAVVMSPMTLLGQTVYAADGKINLSAYIEMAGTLTAVDGTDGNTPAAELLVNLPADMDEKQELDALGVKQLVVDFKVNTLTAYAGEQTGCMAFGMSEAYSWKNGEWVNIAAGESATAKFDLASMDWSGYDRIGKLGLQFANLASGSSVSYEISDIYFMTDASGDSGSSGSQITTDREDSGNVVVTVNAQGQPSNDWSGFELSVDNQTGKSICDWVITMTVPSGSAAKFKCWNATFTADGDTIYLYPNKENSNAVLGTGKMSANPPGFGFSSTWVNASDITITNVAYNYGTQSTIDYSKGDTNDETGGSGSSGGSAQKDTTTDLNLDISYNFAKLLQESLYLYDANMCGMDVTEKTGLSWRQNCHTEDQYASYNGQTVDVSGGYHDAGDHAKFALPQAYTASVLGMSYYQFKGAFIELGQTEHIKKILDHFAEYLEKCAVLDTNGNVIAYCYQVGNGNTDHNYWGAPEKQPSRENQYYFTSDSNPCVDVLCESAAALAIHAVNYSDGKALTYAEKLFAYADQQISMGRTGLSISDPGDLYKSANYEDDYALAAAWLYKATGNDIYKQKYDQKFGTAANPNWSLCWDNVSLTAMLYDPDGGNLSTVSNCLDGMNHSFAKTEDNSYFFLQQWGSARYNAAQQFTALAYDSVIGQNRYGDWATGQMKYILGNNAGNDGKGYCFVVGYNDHAVKYPHHRAASGYNNVSGNGRTSQAHVLLGALVGGPTSTSSSFVDNAEDYTASEVALDYNAGLVGAAAGLYLLHKGEEAYPADLATEAELGSIGVEKYYGTSSGETPSPSPTPSETPSPSPSPTPSETPSLSPTPSETPSPSPTPSETPSPSPTPSETPSPSPTPSETPSPSPTPSETPSQKPSEKPSESPSPSSVPSQKPSESPSATPSPSSAPSQSPSEMPSPSPTPSETPSQQPSESPSATPGQQPSDMPEDDVDETPDEAVEVGDSMDVGGQVYEITQIEDGKVYVTFTEADEDAEDITIPTTFTDAAGRTCYVKEIAPYAFANHKKLKKVKIAEGITKIGKKAFYHCTALKKVTLPGSLVAIGDSAFEGDRSITAITIPKNVKTIGKKAFYKCKKLKTVTLKTTKMKKVGASAFKKTKKGMLFKLPKKKNAAYRKLLKKKYDSGVRFRKIK